LIACDAKVRTHLKPEERRRKAFASARAAQKRVDLFAQLKVQRIVTHNRALHLGRSLSGKRKRERVGEMGGLDSKTTQHGMF